MNFGSADMAPLLLLAAGAIAVPWFSVRLVWFLLWAGAAVAMLSLGVYLCSATAQGWDGLICAIVGILAAPLVLASIAVGIVRVVSTGGGRHPPGPRTVLTASAASYGLAVVTILVMVGLVR